MVVAVVTVAAVDAVVACAALLRLTLTGLAGRLHSLPFMFISGIRKGD